MRSHARLSPDRRYAPVAIFLHWAVAGLILVGWTLPHLRGLLPHERGPIIDLHRSIGVTIFALVLVRLAWRFFNPPPAMPGGTTTIVRWVAHGGHATLYLLMLVVPACGMLLTWAGGHSIPVWGLFAMPAPIALSEDLRPTFQNLHGLLADTLIWLALGHSAAALVHQYVFKDGLLDRMLPGLKRRQRSPSAPI